ncbi:MAG TPA: hypothetical protein VGB55_00985, partial [Tepidisphaeraceae bacterium]
TLPNINETWRDKMVAAVKVVSSVMPSDGPPSLANLYNSSPLVAELIGMVIPQQRIHRIALYCEILQERISKLETEKQKGRLEDPDFADLAEESLHQAVRATTEQRLHYLAALLVNSMTDEDLRDADRKHLMRLLGEISDIELIRLAWYGMRGGEDDEEFFAKHEAILRPIGAHMQSEQSDVDKETIYKSYAAHLEQLGLVRRDLDIDSRTKMPKLDTFNNTWKLNGPRVTSLGRLLLRQIDFGAEDDGNDK